MSERKKFRYKIEELDNPTVEDALAFLNWLGEEGWEYVNGGSNGEQSFFIFKQDYYDE